MIIDRVTDSATFLTHKFGLFIFSGVKICKETKYTLQKCSNIIGFFKWHKYNITATTRWG